MQLYPTIFPPHRRRDPFRRAEARTFDSLKNLPMPGFAYYEWQSNRRSPQLDFALLIVGVGRFGLQVKGGKYRLLLGEWQRWDRRAGRWRPVPTCPLAVTSDAAMSLLNELVHALDHTSFVVPVLAFPDMDQDPTIEGRARRSNVHLIWKGDPLQERLAMIAREGNVSLPPDAAAVRQEVAVITDEQVTYLEEPVPQATGDGSRPVPCSPKSPSPGSPSLRLPNVEIRSMDRLHLQDPYLPL